MASTVEDFRRYNTTSFVLPSGLEVELLRKPQVSMFLGLGELPVPSAAEPRAAADLSAGEIVSLQRYTDRAIARSVLAPPMTDERDEHGQPALSAQRLHVSELDPDDYAALSTAILRHMGLVQEEAKAIESFCADAVGPAGEGTGEGVSLAAVAGAPSNAGRTLS